jgi:hypothetical protein
MERRKKELETEFGTSLGARLDSVKKILNQYGSEELNGELAKSGLLHDTKFVKFLDKITQDVLQVKMVGIDYNAQKALTPQEAQTEMSKKLGNMEFNLAYYNASHPGHKAAVAEMSNLRTLSRG